MANVARGPTVFLVCFLEYRLVFQQLLNLDEQYIFLVVMVRLDKLEPGEAVANKISLVLVGNERGLVVDRIVAAKDRVVWNAMSVRFQAGGMVAWSPGPKLWSISTIGETYAAGPYVLPLT